MCINNDILYREEVANFTNCCSDNYLELNVGKTNEMIIDYSTVGVKVPSLIINNEQVEIVNEYKYLGTILDNKFTFTSNVNAIYKKANLRLYYVRQLSNLNISSKILEIFYVSVVESLLCFAITCWFGNCSRESKGKLTKIIYICINLGVSKAKTLSALYEASVLRRCDIIRKDENHPLCSNYEMLPSGKRLKAIKYRTSRYSNSFVPSSVKLLNSGRKF